MYVKVTELRPQHEVNPQGGRLHAYILLIIKAKWERKETATAKMILHNTQQLL